MGVPSIYRWLVNKYPKIVMNAVEERSMIANDDDYVIYTSKPNPNGVEFDNLYLDMNGIIHPCFHPQDADHPSPPKTFDDVYSNMFEYIDRLFGIVRPRKLLYMAIDGVAPRAKMNQQRSRRFRTSKDCELTELEEERLRKEFDLEGKHVFPKQGSQISDSNIITPGTAFMHELSKALQSYINLRLKNDIGWKNIKVILSDANVPGEGEHKIMSFIRTLRTFPDYDPKTRHCIYGLDADLITLVLATHEVHFSILRENILISEQPPYQSAENRNTSQVEISSSKTKDVFKSRKLKPYQFLHIWILREYLELDMKIPDPPENMKIDLERIIDDFIFICFFTGNDFLPHMPSIEIHEGGIDLLMHVYKDEFKKFEGYLVDMQLAGDENMHYVNLKRVEKFILLVGQKEALIFKKRSELRERKRRRLLSECSKTQEEDGDEFPNHTTSSVAKCSVSTLSKTAAPSNGTSNSTVNYSDMLENTNELKEKLKCWYSDRLDLFKDGSFFVDKVRLGAPGWKQRYYKEKFSAETEDEIENTRKAVVEKYTEGLCWVLLYYFSRAPSWSWYYPYHYGPFASDLKGLSRIKIKFDEGSPFKPFDQLLGVLPPRSAHALPKAYGELMTSDESKIRDFYPSDFEVDTDGKRFLWQGICKLPFINEKRLISETDKLNNELKGDERIRNSTKKDLLFVRSTKKLASQLFSVSEKQFQGRCSEQYVIVKESIPSNLSCGVVGSIGPLDEIFATLNLVEADSLKDSEDIDKESVLCVQYELPSGGRHVPRTLDKVDFPEKTVYEDDIMETQLWHEYPVGGTSYRPQVQDFARRTSVVQSNSNVLAHGVMHKGAGAERSGNSKSYTGYRQKSEDPYSSYRYERSRGRGRGCQNTSDRGGFSRNRSFQVGQSENIVYSNPVSYRGGFSRNRPFQVGQSENIVYSNPVSYRGGFSRNPPFQVGQSENIVYSNPVSYRGGFSRNPPSQVGQSENIVYSNPALYRGGFSRNPSFQVGQSENIVYSNPASYRGGFSQNRPFQVGQSENIAYSNPVSYLGQGYNSYERRQGGNFFATSSSQGWNGSSKASTTDPSGARGRGRA